MEQEKINQIKRLIHLENKISKIRSKYPELKGLDKEKTLMFFSKKIVIEEQEYLSLSDWEYFNVACIIPFEEIEQQLNKYDISSPKMDEVKFIENLQNYYNVSKNIIINRIKNVRKINEVKKMNVLFDYEFSDIEVTKELRDDILKHPEKYSSCDARIRKGMFMTDEEKEKYIEDGLKTPLADSKIKKLGKNKN